MFALITSFGLFLTETAHAESGFTRFYNEYLNIPGFEAWKFFNLAVFIFAAYYITKKKKLPEWFKAKREEIRSELIKAEEEKQAALAKLTAIEARLSQLDMEKDNILQKAPCPVLAVKTPE